jgi:hypothetical protein
VSMTVLAPVGSHLAAVAAAACAATGAFYCCGAATLSGSMAEVLSVVAAAGVPMGWGPPGNASEGHPLSGRG